MGRTLVRPDGSLLRVENDTEAQKLMTLGYREETPSGELERGMELGQEEHYTSFGQKLLTAGEGVLSGATLGGTDLFINGEDTQERARRNPGVRLVSELAGSLSPLLPVKGLKFTPAGALTRGAEAASGLGRGSATMRAGIRGVVEGGGIGANQAVTNAELNDDPLTAETVLAGIGWGALFGGGISALGSRVAEKFEARAAAKGVDELTPTRGEILAGNELDRASGDARAHAAVMEGIGERDAALGSIEERHYAGVHGAMSDASEQLNRAKTTVVGTDIEKAITEAQDALPKPKMELRPLKNDFQRFESNLIDSGDIKLVRGEVRSAQKLLGKIVGAAERGEFEVLQEALDDFANKLSGVTDSLGGGGGAGKMLKGIENAGNAVAKYQDDLERVASPMREAAAKQSTAAAEEVARITAVHKELSKFPKTAEEFANMTAPRIEKLGAAVDKLGALKSAELAGVSEGVKESILGLQQGLGITLEGTPGQQLRGAWQLIKESRGKRAMDFAKMEKEGGGLWDRTRKAEDRLGVARMNRDEEVVGRAGGRVPWAPRYLVGSWAASKAGGGMKSAAAYATGSWLVGALMGMKGAVIGTISEKANTWIPRLGRAVQKSGPRVEPLATRLDGTLDNIHKKRQDLMTQRAKEVAEAAPAIRDTLYRAVQPLAISNPALAVKMHAHAVERFQFLLSKMPKDPGLAYSNLKSLWKPDPVAVEKFARYYAVFQNPVAVVSAALDTGKISLESAEGLKNMNPELFNYLRSAMFQRISDPAIMKKMSYADQVHMGILLDMPLHSTMDPRFIAPQQQMYLERNEPLEMNPRITPGGGAGRPSGPGPSATAAQRTTEH